ncbi:hypothetical protein CC2G_005918 [Coprinopsis cinerea AmutBmut pab1-1]|nr:hypothetical protein CC2G_005918 [Coprinopsis cinerea AmutBmut pab1-1]
MLKRFNMDACNKVDTPLPVGQPLTKDMGPQTPAEVEEMRNVPFMFSIIRTDLLRS